MMTPEEYRDALADKIIEAIDNTGDRASDGRVICYQPMAVHALARALATISRTVPGIDDPEFRAGYCCAIAELIAIGIAYDLGELNPQDGDTVN